MSANSVGDHAPAPTAPPAITVPQSQTRNRRVRKVEKLQAELEMPFDPGLIQWRAKEFRHEHGLRLGLCLPYADSRGYRDRLNLLFTPVGWKDELEVTTEPPKIIVTCQLTLEGLGTKSAVGEDWLKNENAATTAQAQAFKRACSCFGLGRYLYSFTGQWLQLDNEMRPVTPPIMPEWATPEGWRRGLRPDPAPIKPVAHFASPSSGGHRRYGSVSTARTKLRNVVLQIRDLEPQIGRSMYRGLLKTVANVWDPSQIRKIELQHKVLALMMSAKRGLARYQAACQKLPPATVEQVLVACELRTIEDVADMETLQQLVRHLESATQGT
jgi:Rad52/22 family double-strand break repair protein